MVSWSFAGRRSALAIIAGVLGSAARGAGRSLASSRAAILPALRLAARMVLVLAAAGLAVAGVAVLAGLGWSLLTGALACLFLEWIVKDAGAGRAARPDDGYGSYRNGAQ